MSNTVDMCFLDTIPLAATEVGEHKEINNNYYLITYVWSKTFSALKYFLLQRDVIII